MSDTAIRPTARNVVRQITLRMTSSMYDDLAASYLATYGNRGAARWLEEAVASFLDLKDFIIRVGAGEATQVFEVSRPVSLSPKTQVMLEGAIRRYRKFSPLESGVKSQIIRAAIRHRLTNEGVPEPQPEPVVEIKMGRLVKKA